MDSRSLAQEIDRAQSKAQELRTRAVARDTLALSALAELDSALEELVVVQETLRERTAALAERTAATMQPAAIRSHPAGIAGTRLVETTLDGRILAASPRAAETLNTGSHSLVRKPIANFVPLKDRPEFRWRVARLARGETDRDRWVQTLVPRDGAARDFDVAVFSIRENGTTRLVWVFHVAPNRELDDASAAVDGHPDIADEPPEGGTVDERFLMTVVHELRTPINAISSYLSLLRHESVDEAIKLRAFDVIERNTALQAQLISDLADRVHLTNGQVRLRLRSLDLRSIAAQAVDAVRRLADAAHQNLQLTLPSDPVMINGDDARLQQIAGNLLSNAMKFTPAGGRIVVEVVQGTGTALLRVEDSGAGISDAFHKRLFGSHQQDGRTVELSQGGFGLGLWIVRQLVEAHGGTVSATSDGEGRGTTLTVELPLLSN